MPEAPKKKSPNSSGAKRISQTDIPAVSLEQALKVAQSIWEDYGGQETAPHDIAIALDISPTSSAWRTLTGASIAYGLTEGGYNSSAIRLTDLGRSVVAPTTENEDTYGLKKAALVPRIPAEFFKQYDRSKWPRDKIAENVLVNKGVPKDRAKGLVQILQQNADFTGFLRSTKTGPFVALDSDQNANREGQSLLTDQYDNGDSTENHLAELLNDNSDGPDETKQQIEGSGQTESKFENLRENQFNNRVFITHGKDTAAMEQIKEVVSLGGFEPVVSVQRETAAKPVPEKVMDDMRSCSAAIIHVSSETVLKDADGNEHTQINPNVLIEIGASMALFHGRFILLVEEGIQLPSNLQGLYQSRYSGGELSLAAGMKILKALRGMNEEVERP